MAQYNFGTGQVYTTPVGGGAPLRIGALQDVSVDFSGDVKQLFGQYQFPIDNARGKTKIEGKIGTANIDVAAFNAFFFGSTLQSNSEKRQAINEQATIATTVNVANAASFFIDLGVFDSATGTPYKQVPTNPAAGQYSVNPGTGVYTFAAADVGKVALFNYLFTATTPGSGTMDITNQLLGATPKFQLIASQVYNGKAFTLMLYSCIADKLSLPLKQDDYTIPEISFSAQSNDAGRIGFLTTSSAVGGGS